MIAWDLCGSGIGDLVGLAEGPESTQPFYPDVKPLDASIVAAYRQRLDSLKFNQITRQNPFCNQTLQQRVRVETSSRMTINS